MSPSATTDKPGPSTQHARFRAIAEAAQLPRLLRAGTMAMRESEAWLPKSPGESEDGYDLRRKRSFLFGKYPDVCEALGNALFAGELTVEPVAAEGAKDDAPKGKLSPEAEAWLEDFDLQGQTLEEWLMTAFGEALDCGLVHALAEHPTIGISENRAEEQAKGGRPYATIFLGDDVLQADTSRAGGQERLERVNLRIMRTKSAGWGEVTEKGTLVVYAGDPTNSDLGLQSTRWARWEKFWQDENGKDPDVAQEKGNYRPHVEIPLRTFYARRTGFLQGRPALQRLAEKNAEHFQSSSHQRMNLDFSRFSLIFRKGFGADERKQTKIGGAAMFDASKVDADMKMVEAGGAGLTAGRQHLEDCKAEMQDMALQPFLSLGAMTAHQVMVEKGEADNQVAAWAINLERFVQELLGLFVIWTTAPGVEPKPVGEATLRIDDALTMTPAQLEFVKYLGEGGLLSQETILRYGKESGLLPAWLDVAAEIARTKDEAPVLKGVPMALPGGKGAPPVPPQAPPAAVADNPEDLVKQPSPKGR